MMEHLQKAYVAAVVARAGAGLNFLESDYGVDALVQQVVKLGKRYRSTGPGFRIQAKASTTCGEDDQYIVYDMDADAYNHLAEWEDEGSPIYLVLFRMPAFEEWLLWSEDELMLRSCCYYFKVPSGSVGNSSSTRIRIPKAQVFTPFAVNTIIQDVRNKAQGF